MDEADSHRAYLTEALATQGVDWKQASLAIGMSHAYIQQYLKAGKPRYLPEITREKLVSLYGLDRNRLRPTFIQEGASEADPQAAKASVRKPAPYFGEPLEDADEIALIAFWRSLTRAKKYRAAALLDIVPPSMRNEY